MRCIAQPLRGSTTTKRASDSPNINTPIHTHTHPPKRLGRTPALAHTSSLDTDLTRNARAPHFTPQHWLCAIWD